MNFKRIKITLFLILVFGHPALCQDKIKNMTLIQKVRQIEDQKGLTIELKLNQPLKKQPEWFTKENKIVIPFDNSYINPPKIPINLKQPILKGASIAQYDPKTVNVVFIWKEAIPEGIIPNLAESEDKLKFVIFLPYKMEAESKTTIQPEASVTESIQGSTVESTVTSETVSTPTIDESDQLFHKAPLALSKKSPKPKDDTMEKTPVDKNSTKENELNLNLNNDEKVQIPSFSKSLVKSFISLLIVLGLLILTAYILKRFFFKGTKFDSSGKSLRILSSIYIGDKKRICLVEVLGRILVLGVTNTSIDLLTEIEGDKVMDIVSDEEKGGSKLNSFKKAMKDAGDKFDSEKIDKKAKNLSDTLKNILSKDQST